MIGLLDRLTSREVVIWGVGAMQTDVEALFDLRVAYYIDDDYEQKKDRIHGLSRPVLSSAALKAERGRDLLIIVCIQEYGPAFTALADMGFCERDQFVSYERLLYECDFMRLCQAISGRRVALWGIGKTFFAYEKFLYSAVSDIGLLIDETKPGGETLPDGRQVLPFDRARDDLQDCYVVVASTYYPVIAEKLKALGKQPIRDFIFVDTYWTLHGYASSFREADSFIDRKKDATHLVIVLAGYKKPLWDNVFARLKRFTPEHYDVCVVSSGLQDESLNRICAEYGWSYLSTAQNKISAALNNAIHLHKKATYVFKLDEDMFVTEGIFETLLHTHREFACRERYEVGFVSPLIPVNNYGYMRLLETLGLEDRWRSRFGEPKNSDGMTHHLQLLRNPEAAQFMWGEGSEELRNIDALAARLRTQPLRYSVCPSRYSIGMILFLKETWLDMKLFPITEGNNLGADEEHICKYCMMSARVMVVAENALAGHLGYGPQTAAMLEYHEKNIESFALPEE